MKRAIKPAARELSRRDFLVKAGSAVCAAALCGQDASSCFATDKFAPSVVVFTKVYQTLNLNFEAAAAVTAEAGLDGVDCPVRPGGEIEPERATEELPRYAETLRARNLKLPLLTTAITSVSSPHTEEILRTARKLGVQYYRLGFVEREKDGTAARQLQEVKVQLKDLAALNKQIGIGGVVQNHSPAGRTYLGGDLGEMEELVAGFDPAQIGVAFDIGHALIVHGDGWRSHFEKLKSHLRVAYVKDAKRPDRWVRFGEGEVGQTGYFKLLRQIGYDAPISLHLEYDWSDAGKSKNRAALVKALRESSVVLKQWLAEG